MLLVVEIVLPMGEADRSRGWGTPSTAGRRFVLSKKKEEGTLMLFSAASYLDAEKM